MKKKLLFVLLAGCLVMMTACTSDKGNADSKDVNVDEHGWDLSGLDDIDETDNDVDEEDDIDLSSYESGFGDTFFVDGASYTYLCDDMLEAEDYPKFIGVKVSKEADGIYHMVIEEQVDAFARECGDWDRLDLGYFLVDEDTIYNLTGGDEAPSAEMIKSEGRLVYVKESAISEYSGKMAESNYVQWLDGRCGYHYFNNLTESGFYETIYWDENGNMISYRSGFGAEAEQISFYVPESN